MVGLCILLLLFFIFIFLRPTSTKPQAEILKLNNVNGCNDISFGDHSILEGDCIPPLKSHGQALEELHNSELKNISPKLTKLSMFGAKLASKCQVREYIIHDNDDDDLFHTAEFPISSMNQIKDTLRIPKDHTCLTSTNKVIHNCTVISTVCTSICRTWTKTCP